MPASSQNCPFSPSQDSCSSTPEETKENTNQCKLSGKPACSIQLFSLSGTALKGSKSQTQEHCQGTGACLVSGSDAVWSMKAGQLRCEVSRIEARMEMQAFWDVPDSSRGGSGGGGVRVFWKVCELRAMTEAPSMSEKTWFEGMSLSPQFCS